MSIKAITFDYWDTIFKMDSEFNPKVFRIEKAKMIISQFKINLDDRHLADLIDEVWKKFDDEWQNNYRTMTTEEIIDFILTKLEVKIPNDQFESLVIFFQEAILKSPPKLFDGVREAIDQLSKKYKLGIISDTGFTPGRVLRKILEMNDLRKYFSVCIFSDEFGKSKPHPDVFYRAAKSLECDISELVHIGDNERTDISGADSSGARSILFIKEKIFSGSTKATAVLDHWKNCIELISNLENGILKKTI